MIHHSKTFIDKEELMVLNKTVNNGMLSAGDENINLKKEFSHYIESDYIKLTSSGTMAFFLILKALDIQKGDEILLPDYICKDLLGAVFATGAIPTLYDNRVNSWLSSVDEILPKVTLKTKIVLVNHTFGFVFKEIETLANRLPSNVSIVEDCCHAIFGKNNPLKDFTRNYSLCCFYSFNATKLLTSGEGGAISSNDKNFIAKIEKIQIGDKLSDLNCAIARTQLRRLDTFINRRKYIAEIYLDAFKNLISSDFLTNAGIYFRFPLLINENQQFWKSKSVSFRKGVDSLLSEELKIQSMPNANNIFQKTVSIPIYPALDDTMIFEIILETKRLIQS